VVNGPLGHADVWALVRGRAEREKERKEMIAGRGERYILT